MAYQSIKDLVHWIWKFALFLLKFMKRLTVDPSVGFPSVVPKTFSRQNFITKSYLLSSTICKNLRPIEWSSLSKIWSKKSTNSVRSFSKYRGQLVSYWVKSSIDVGDGFWRQNVFATTLRCCWPIYYVKKLPT